MKAEILEIFWNFWSSDIFWKFWNFEFKFKKKNYFRILKFFEKDWEL
jgi:hypothetical protein